MGTTRLPHPMPRIVCLCFGAPVAQAAWEELLEALGQYTPLIEEGRDARDGPCIYLDARGIVPRYESEPSWCAAILAEVGVAQARAGLGLARSKFAAWVAARSAPTELGHRIVAQADRNYLAPLSVTWLPLAEEVQRRLRLLGLRSMGQFAALARNAVAEQFGSQSLVAHAWARGLDERPVLGRRCQVLEAQHAFEVAEDRREALVAQAVRLGQRALGDLPGARQGWAIRRVELTATTAEGETVRRSAWLGDAPGAQTLRTLLGQMVEGLRGESLGICALRVRLVGLEPAPGRQLDLFAYRETRLRLEQTLQGLARKHSPACVVQAELRDPDAPLLAERYALRAYAP